MALPYDRGTKDERTMKALRDVLMQRVQSGIIVDALLRVPDWHGRRKVPSPCQVWALCRDSGTRDTGWLYEKLLTDLSDAGARPHDVELTFQPLSPGETTAHAIAELAARTGTVRLTEIDAEERAREGKRGAKGHGRR